MKIIPLSDIAVAGVHCPAGIPVEVSERDGALLVHEGRARRAGVAAVETAAMARPAERAVNPPLKTRR